MVDTEKLRERAAKLGEWASEYSVALHLDARSESDMRSYAREAWLLASAALEIEQLRERLATATGLLRDARDYGEFHDDGREIVGDIGAFLDRD
jgi:hypothetical protein